VSRLAIDAGGTWLRYELSGEEEACGKIPSHSMGLGAFIASMVENHGDIDAVAISFAGQVHEGVIISSPNLPVDEPEIEAFAMARYGIKLRIENDLNCAALAESVYWNETSLAAIYAGTGLGSGIIEKGEILHGWRSLAGEIGHVPYKKAPFRCGCGKDNCYELYTSGSGLQKWMAHEGCSGTPDLARLRLDPKCRRIAEMFDEALTSATATVVTLLNPKIVVFGGGVIAENPDVVQKVRERIGEYALAASCEDLRIEMSGIENASLEGAKLLLDTI
jgi:predicted NBD/HSP70 family sugar kinase